jgi:hypothetical protein
MKFHKHLIAAVLSSLCICGVTFAGDQDSKPESSEQSQKQHKDQGDRQSNSNANYQVSPSGWIRMAVDYDNDGSFDAIETIYTFDLEKARKSSRDRANRDAQKADGKQRSSSNRQNDAEERSSGDRMAGNQQQETISGKILQLQTEKLFGMDEPCVIARLRTDENWPAKAVLGPKSTLKKLQLAEGDDVTVTGRKGRINDKSMLLASSVKSGGNEVTVDMPSSRNAKRIRGELLKMRTTEFEKHDGQFVIAEIQCQNGKKATVNLGAKSKLDQLNLSEGDEIRLIVRPAKMNGKPGMVADEVMANGKSVNVSPSKQTTKAMRQRDSNKRDRDDQANSRENRDSKSQKSGRNSTQDSAQNSGARSNWQDSDDAKQSQSKQAALGIAIGETGEGVVILSVHPDSPAADTDLQVGDAIVSIDGNSVDSPSGLVDLITKKKPNDTIQMKIRREGEDQTVKVKLTSLNKLMDSLR